MEQFTTFQQDAHTAAIAHGWWSPPKSWDEQVALFHSEVSEAFEHWRDNRAVHEVFYAPESYKPDGVPIEFADLVIRLLDSAGWYHIDHLYAHITARTVSPRNFAQVIAHLHALIAKLEESSHIERAFGDLLGYVFAACRFYGIDLFRAIEIKILYNETRAYKHGGKRV